MFRFDYVVIYKKGDAYEANYFRQAQDVLNYATLLLTAASVPAENLMIYRLKPQPLKTLLAAVTRHSRIGYAITEALSVWARLKLAWVFRFNSIKANIRSLIRRHHAGD